MLINHQRQTVSEQLFEQYMLANEYRGWEHEPTIEGKRKRPDYRLPWQGFDYFFEVKEFHGEPPSQLPHAEFYDPYAPVREAINQARIKFREFRQFCCSLVVHNIDNECSRLDPEQMFAAMLGNLGFKMPLDSHRGIADATTMEIDCLGGGKMIDPKSGKPQNTTISAIIVLENVHTEHCVRARVFENPVRNAKNPHAPQVPSTLFRGPNGERWQFDTGPIQVFRGRNAVKS